MTDTNQTTLTLHELACMRALHPDKRNLPFNDDGIAAVTSSFHANYPATPLAMLTGIVTPTPGDKTWAGMAMGLRGIASGPTKESATEPYAPVAHRAPLRGDGITS